MWDLAGYVALVIVVVYLAVVLWGVWRGKFDTDDETH
jgi:nitrogen fixation-related uncharacterized protein